MQLSEADKEPRCTFEGTSPLTSWRQHFCNCIYWQCGCNQCKYSFTFSM